MVKVYIPLALSIATVANAACTSGDTYHAGKAQAHAQFDAGWSYVNEKCSSVDTVVNQVKDAGPGKSAPDCQVDGFSDGLEEAEAEARKTCPNTPDGCSNESTYEAGRNQAAIQWDSSYKYIGSCSKLDDLEKVTSKNGPIEPPCLERGFQDELYDKYVGQMGEPVCAKECEKYGEELAEDNWKKTQKAVGDDCASVDQTLTQVLSSAPQDPPCRNDAYVAKTNELYKKDLADCVSECIENGEDLGERLGEQFCNTVALFADDDGLVLIICDEQEKMACENALEEYVTDHCFSDYKDKSNKQFYKDLKKTCKITIGPDKPGKPETKPVKCKSKKSGVKCNDGFLNHKCCPDDSCKGESSCSSKTCCGPDLKKCKKDGAEQGADAWTKARRQVGETCGDLDKAFAKVNKNAPTSPACIQKSYLNTVNDLYTDAQETCISECEGYGVIRGQNQADQFCSVVQLFADDDSGITQFICNTKEQEACYDAMDERIEYYTLDNGKSCSTLLDNPDDKTQDLYDELRSNCKATIGFDQR